MTDVERAALNLRAAIMDEGDHPEHHRRIMRRHRAEWPTLWRAIDEIVSTTTRQNGMMVGIWPSRAGEGTHALDAGDS